MPFITRVTETPTLAALAALEQIVIVDKAGPVIPFGQAPGAVCMVGEFLKGPFKTREVVSTADLIGAYGAVSNLISQTLAGLQDGSGARHDGNGLVALLGKTFARLMLSRVDTDMTTTDGGAGKAYLKFVVAVHASDEDPLNVGFLGRDLLVPAGTRFADAAIGSETAIVCLSQDVLIPRGTKIDLTGPPAGYLGRIWVAPTLSIVTPLTYNLSQGTDGNLTANRDTTTGLATTVALSIGPTAFFSKGTTFGSGVLDFVIDSAIPSSSSIVASLATTTVAGDNPSTVNLAGTATAVFAAGTAAATLSVKTESRYSAAIDRTKPSDYPMIDIDTIFSARRGETAAAIRTPLVNNAIDSSSESRGRVALVDGPRIGSATGDVADISAYKTAVLSTVPLESPGRQDRKIVCGPAHKVYSVDLGRNVVVHASGTMGATLSNFPAYKNPGAPNKFIQNIVELDDPFIAAPFVKQDFINFKAKGVAMLRNDRSVGWQFQSGVTSVDPVIYQNLAPIKRRRMADFLQDTMAMIAAKFEKEPATQDRIDQFVGEIRGFLDLQAFPPNDADKSIEDYLVDEKSGNTPQLVALGLFTLIVKCRLLASLDTIIFQTQIGETVEVV